MVRNINIRKIENGFLLTWDVEVEPRPDVPRYNPPKEKFCATFEDMQNEIKTLLA